MRQYILTMSLQTVEMPKIPVRFSQKEVSYIKSQPLARIGTANKKGNPDVAAVGFDFDGEYLYISSRFLTKTNKYRNDLENPKASLTIDDLETLRPWRPRGIKVRGTTELVITTATLDRGNTYA